MTAGPNFPQFYRKPVALNRETHTGLTIAESAGRYAFAAKAQTVLMASVEFFDACREFPIIFTRTGDGRTVPLALMGLENGENLFVDGQGNWQGTYIPAYIRRYPFITADGADGRMTVCFDEAFDGFNREGGAALFADGEPTPKMQEIASFLKNYYGHIKQTEQFGTFLAEAGLLRPLDAQVNLADGRRFVLNGMLMVDEQKLAQLPDTEIVRLFRSGSLALIDAHLLSLRNLDRLMSMTGQRIPRRPAQIPAEENSNEETHELVLSPMENGTIPFRQPMRQIKFVLQYPEIFHREALDERLQSVLEIDLEPCICLIPQTGRTDQEARVIELARRCLLVAGALLQTVGIPVFDAGGILNIEQDRQNSSKSVITAALVHVDYIPQICYELAVEAATKIVQNVMGSAPFPENMENLYRDIEDRLLRPARERVVSGKSTIPVLRSARQMDIPFLHLGGGIYQLGWGGKARYIDRSATDADPLLGAKMAQHKGWAANLLRAAGLPGPDHGVVGGKNEAVHRAHQLGWPVVVKPADRDRGEGIATGINNDAALLAAFESAKERSSIQQVIIEREVPGVCHRLLVVNGRVLYAVKRLPKSVSGDGRQTVAGLIRTANQTERTKAPWLRSEPYPDDALAVATVQSAGFSLESIPDAGERIPLRPVESTEWGGEDLDVTARLHPDYGVLALRAAALFGLHVAGIDIITTDIDKPWHSTGAIINEVNFAPVLGDGPVSSQYIPQFLKEFIDGGGRIPVEAFIGSDAAMAAAKERQREHGQNGIRCFLTSHALTLDDAGTEIFLTCRSLFQRCRALLMNRRVEALILVVETDEWLYTGFPVDRFTRVTPIEDTLTSWKDPGERLPKTRVDTLLKPMSEGMVRG